MATDVAPDCRMVAIAASSDASSSGVSTEPSARRRSRTPSRKLRGTSGCRRRRAQVVAVVLQPLAHLQHVAMAFGGEQRDLRALAFEQRVGRNRCAVHDALRLLQHLAAREVEPARELVEAGEHADRLVLRRRRRFRERGRAVRVDGDEVGKGAADVDADGVGRHLARSRGRGRHEPQVEIAALRLRCCACSGRPSRHRRRSAPAGSRPARW